MLRLGCIYGLCMVFGSTSDTVVSNHYKIECVVKRQRASKLQFGLIYVYNTVK